MGTDIRRWSPERAGCIYAGANTRTADELNALTIKLAVDEGWDDRDARIDADEVLAQYAPHGVLWSDDPELSEAVAESAERAVGWLTEHVAPEGYVFEFDDGLYLWPEDDEGLEL